MSRVLPPGREKVDDLFRPGDQDKKDGIERMRALANAGLVWDRYLDIWQDGGFMLVDGDARRPVLDRFACDVSARRKAQKPSNSHPAKLLEVLHARQVRVVERLPGKAAIFPASLESRLALGLGTPHPTEIGFTFDRSIGVPYLPGSSVKGLCRAAARLAEVAPPRIEELFGPEKVERDASGHIGDLVFMDAYPSALPKFEVDLINCHHPAYYGGQSRYPAETESPVPVYFLTAAPGTAWIFRLMSRSGKHTEQAVELLALGLSELGAGGKTAVGYGVFSGSRP